ncbi:MAG: hypothetical protein IJG33_00265 [Selenomonadaceae bacterium]|nr:hypothetical protein [Selenomonadaceae bacterium]
MADIIKTSTVLNIECVFIDGDTRTITLRSPKSNISSSEIESLESSMRNENIIIGDRDTSDFRKIKQAIKRETTTTYLDLG